MSQEEWIMIVLKGKHHSMMPAVQVLYSLLAVMFYLFKSLKS